MTKRKKKKIWLRGQNNSTQTQKSQELWGSDSDT